MDVAEGTVIERYRVLRRLGAGGMATVWLVQHGRIGSLHALKVLDVPSRKIRERLVREGQVQGLVRHPNIVSVSDVLEYEGCPCLLMELVAGPSLEGLLSEQRLSVDQVDSLARGLLAGVGAAHAQGLVHRDLKPANVLLGLEEGGVVPKVADFGLAKVLAGSGEVAATRSGVTMGTPAYMAPEQIRDASRVDARADVFSLGAVLYELLTGARPFEGADTFAIFESVTRGRRAPLLEREPGTPARMAAAVEAALSLDPAERPADANALLALWVADTAAPEAPWSEAELERMREAGPALPEISLGGPFSAPSGGEAPRGAPSSEPTLFPDPASAAAPPRLTPAPPPPALPAPAPRRPQALLAGLLVVGLVAAALFALSLRTTEALYADLELRHGALVPVGPPLTELPFGEVAWLVREQGGRLLSATRVNHTGHPPDPRHEHDIALGALRQSWEGGRPTAIARYSASGLLRSTLRLTHSPEGVDAALVDPRGWPVTSKVALPIPLGRLVSRERWRFNDDGLLVEATWLDATGAPMADARGVFGLRRSFDAEGALVGLGYLDADGQPMLNAEGVAAVALRRDEAGREIERALLDFGGRPVVGAEAWSVRRDRFDALGRRVERAHFDAAGQPVIPALDHGACAVERREYAAPTVTTRCFDAEDRPAIDSHGAHAAVRVVDARGHTVAVRYRDAAGEAVESVHGHAEIRYVRDASGQSVEHGPQLGASGQRTSDPKGIGRIALRYDARGLVEEEQVFDVHDAPTVDTSGSGIVTYRYDEVGDRIETRYFDPARRPTLGPRRCHVERRVNSPQRWRDECLDAEGALAPDLEGVAVIERSLDPVGREVERRFFDAEGGPAAGPEGAARVVWRYDAAGREVERAWYDREDALMLHAEDGYARLTLAYDSYGRVVEERFYGADDRPIGVEPLGASIWRKRYDARGRLEWLHLFDGEGRPLPGCSLLRSGYDDLGQENYEACFDANERPVLRFPGALHATRWVYDALGRKTHTFYYDTEGERTKPEGQAAEVRFAYEGNFRTIVRAEARDLDGELEDDSFGYATYRVVLDSLGRPVGQGYLDAEGRAIEVNGVAWWESVLDAHGRVLAYRRYRADGEPGSSRGDSFQTRFLLDSRGNRIESWNLDEHGRPSLSRGSWYRATYTFDAAGRELGWRQFDLDNQPTLGSDGYFRQANTYDALGRRVSEQRFGVADEPVNGHDGWHRDEVTYDARGQELRRAHFGTEAEPVRTSEGWHARERRYDRVNRLVEERWLDTDGSLVRGPDGFARRTLTYPPSGAEPAESRFDALDRLID